MRIWGCEVLKNSASKFRTLLKNGPLRNRLLNLGPQYLADTVDYLTCLYLQASLSFPVLGSSVKRMSWNLESPFIKRGGRKRKRCLSCSQDTDQEIENEKECRFFCSMELLSLPNVFSVAELLM